MAYHCEHPYQLPDAQKQQYFDVAAQKWRRHEVACGRCRSCQTNRKQDWSGKLMAEAMTSAAVTYVTLTYAKEPEAFCYSEVQRMLKAFRMYLGRQHKINLRYFVVGERGDLRGRIHWHAIFFFSKPHKIVPPKPGEKWRFWPHGWTNVQNLPDRATVAVKVRYCAKYAVKSLGREDWPNPKGSLKPSLGALYFMQRAVAAAEAGIPPRTEYSLPGVRYSFGHREGQHERFRLVGGCRRAYFMGYPHDAPVVEGYLQAWVRTHGDADPPWHPDWSKWDVLCKAPGGLEAKDAVRLLGKRPARVAAARKPVPLVKKIVTWGHGKDRDLAEVWVDTEHPFRLSWHWSLHDYGHFQGVALSDTVAGMAPLTSEAVAELDAWIRKQRGPAYGTDRGDAEGRLQGGREAWSGAVLSEYRDACDALRLRVKHGTKRGAARIYDPDWQPAGSGAAGGVISDHVRAAIEQVAAESGNSFEFVRGRIGNRAAAERFAERCYSEGRAAAAARRERTAEGAIGFPEAGEACETCSGAGANPFCPECGCVSGIAVGAENAPRASRGAADSREGAVEGETHCSH